MGMADNGGGTVDGRGVIVDKTTTHNNITMPNKPSTNSSSNP